MFKDNNKIKLDFLAKFFPLEKKFFSNFFRLSVILNKNIRRSILLEALNLSLNNYPYFKVKLKNGLFWNYLVYNNENPIVFIDNNINQNFDSFDFKANNNYLFKTSYKKDIINIDFFHSLTDGNGALIFFKDIVYNYLDIIYHIKNNNNSILVNTHSINNLKRIFSKSFVTKKQEKAFKIVSNKQSFKNYYFILNVNDLKKISKKYNVTITEYLTSLLIYSIYKTVYIGNNPIVICIPINLRKKYNIKSLTNFFTRMHIKFKSKDKDISFEELIKEVSKQFKYNFKDENINYFSNKELKLCSNPFINGIPLFIKKWIISINTKRIRNYSTTILTNLGVIYVDDIYKKYIKNFNVSMSTNNLDNIKCSISTYDNKLTFVFNTFFENNKIEKYFYYLLKKNNVKTYARDCNDDKIKL